MDGFKFLKEACQLVFKTGVSRSGWIPGVRPLGGSITPGYEITNTRNLMGEQLRLNSRTNSINYGNARPHALNVGLDLQSTQGWEEALRRCAFFAVAKRFGLTAVSAMGLMAGKPQSWKALQVGVGVDRNWRGALQKKAQEILANSDRNERMKGEGIWHELHRLSGNSVIFCHFWNWARKGVPPPKGISEIPASIEKIDSNSSPYSILCQLELQIRDPKKLLPGSMPLR